MSAPIGVWDELRQSGRLARFCFISLGILLHATNETMVATVMPGMVADISGVQLVGWSLAIYEVGSIVAGAASGRMLTYLPLRTNMAGAALVYTIGALICATAPAMEWLLAGRLLQGFGGGALVALAFVSVERLFPRHLWPQLFAIISVVWGVAAFSGPLLGAVISEMLSWRWSFGLFAVAGGGMAAVAFVALSTPEAARRVPPPEGGLPPFPFATLACLAIAITFIALAGVLMAPVVGALLLLAGLAGLAGFFFLDARTPSARLFPRRPLDPSTQVGRGLIMFAAFSMGTVAFTLYGPLILTSMHGMSAMTAGYLIAAGAISWSVMSILVSGAKAHQEPRIILAGAAMIAAGMVGFVFAVPSGSIPALLACALIEGGGFGLLWPFATRLVVSAAAEGEQTIASSAVPTIQRIGYAVGAAFAGIIANLAGFGLGLSEESAGQVARWLFAPYLPLAVIGLYMTARILLAERRGAAVQPRGGSGAI